MNNRKLNLQRNKLDKIDNKLLNLVKKRTNIVKKVIKLKKYKKQIVDHKRINEILLTLKKKSIVINISIELAVFHSLLS